MLETTAVENTEGVVVQFFVCDVGNSIFKKFIGGECSGFAWRKILKKF